MLRTRVWSALLMGAVLAGALFLLDSLGWALFMVAIMTVAAWEWGGFARSPGASRWAFAALVALVCVASAHWTGLDSSSPISSRSHPFYIAAAAFWIIAAPVWLLLYPRPAPQPVVALAGIVVLVPTYLAVLELRGVSAAVMLMVMAIVWIADVAAYFAGKRFGRHKLAPAVSPGKTWEGLAGALIAVAIYAAAGARLFQLQLGASISLTWILGAALALSIVSVLGDLFESAMKRQAGLKDSSNVLPGHGGILDRIDALTPVLPLAALSLAR